MKKQGVILPLALAAIIISAGMFIPFHSGIPQMSFILGVMLVAGKLLGDVFEQWRLPRISGYLITGLTLSRNVTGVLPQHLLNNFEPFRMVALVLIAMGAGYEFNLKIMKREYKRVVSLSLFTFVLLAAGVTAGIYILLQSFNIISLPHKFIFSLSLVLGIISTANSPLSTIAIIDETGIKNKFARTILGVTIFKDIILIFIIMGLLIYLDKQFSGSGHSISLFEPMYELLGSIIAGGSIGIIMHYYFKLVNARNTIVLILAAFLLGELCRQIKLNPIMFGLTFGFVLSNFSSMDVVLKKSLDEATAIIFILFFGLNGAWIKSALLTKMWLVSAFILVLRFIFVYLSVYLSESAVGHSKIMKQWGWTGFMNQAGIALAIAIIINQRYSAFGAYVYPIALGMIVITDFITPPLFKIALRKSGKAK